MLSLIATSCASDDAPSSSGGDSGVSAGTAADAQAALTGAGVAVVDSPTPVVTDAVFTLTKSQAQFVAEEAVAGAGLLGTTLDSASYKRLTIAGASVPTSGNNQNWDYSTLKDSFPTVTKYYFTPAAQFGASPAAFSDARNALSAAM